MLGYLFAEPDVWGKEPVPLAVDGRICTPTNCIHFPVGVVVVHHMEIPVSTPWHSLDKAFTKMIECYSDLHVLVLGVRITVSQKHNLVMMGHVIVGDGDGRGSMNGINETITTIRQRAMINPNMLRIKDGHTITV